MAVIPGPAAAPLPGRGPVWYNRAGAKEGTPMKSGAILLLAALAGAPSPAEDALEPLDLRQVRVGGEIGRRIDVTLKNNLLVLDAEKDFLQPFREKSRRDGYIGLGKLIDAAVRLAAYSGDEKAVALKKRLVEEAIKAQGADGYAGIMKPAARMWGLWDVHEVQYLAWGLLSDHRFFGEKASLDGARKAADYIVERWGGMPERWGEKNAVAADVAVTGLERTMVALHRATGEKRYLDFVLKERALADWDLGIVIGRRPLIEGHIYAYMARCLAQLELHRVQPDAKLLAQTRRAMDFLVRGDGLALTGGAGMWEIWTDDQDVRGELGETCATAYQLRVYDSLLRLEGDPRLGDLMERTIYNALFAAQSPDGRRLRYFAPLEGKREYWPGDTYCCPCNYRRIVAELPQMAYYRSKGGLAVNLYGASEAKADLGGAAVSVRQETDYPNSGRVVLKVEPAAPARFPIRLRIPLWAAGAKAAVNGQAVEGPARPGTFLEIDREWKAGDAVTLDLPMAWRLVKGRKRQSGRAAVMRGPVVYCLNPEPNKAIANWDGADLSRITLDPASLGEPAPSDAVRPGGTACRVKAWKPGFDLSLKGDLELTLTEFPDPNGRATCFRLRDMSAAVDDELLSGGR